MVYFQHRQVYSEENARIPCLTEYHLGPKIDSLLPYKVEECELR